jgi:hypothetical protein
VELWKNFENFVELCSFCVLNLEKNVQKFAELCSFQLRARVVFGPELENWAKYLWTWQQQQQQQQQLVPWVNYENFTSSFPQFVVFENNVAALFSCKVGKKLWNFRNSPKERTAAAAAKSPQMLCEISAAAAAAAAALLEFVFVEGP